MLELSYAGSHSNYLQNNINLNSVPIGAMSDTAALQTKCPSQFTQANPTSTELATEIANAQGNSACQQQFRPFSNYQTVNAQESSQKSQYDALQVSLQRSAGWATISLNYSFAKNLFNPNHIRRIQGLWRQGILDGQFHRPRPRIQCRLLLHHAEIGKPEPAGSRADQWLADLGNHPGAIRRAAVHCQ